MGYIAMSAPFSSKIPSKQYINSIFEFVNNKLTWKYRPESHFDTENKWELFNTKHCGKEAGKYGERGYGRVVLDGYSIPISKVCYMVQCEEEINIDDLIIDHIDGNTKNNHISNLRIATPSQNSCNKKLPSNNTTGIKGVDWNVSSNRFRARVCVEGKRYTKYYETIFDAAASVISMRKRYQKEFSTERVSNPIADNA